MYIHTGRGPKPVLSAVEGCFSVLLAEVNVMEFRNIARQESRNPDSYPYRKKGSYINEFRWSARCRE